MTDNDSILDRVRELLEEEHELRAALEDGNVTAADEHARVTRIEEELDQLGPREGRVGRVVGGQPALP
jgi:hypothetical protein